MDYLDSKKDRRQRALLLTGYVLVALAIVMTTLVLLQLAYGYTLDKKGAVIQKGLTFFSSHPSPANIYVNGQLQSVRTNTRLYIPAGIYDVKLSRTGYFDWQRKIELDGGSVQHYDYPFLIPKTLTTKAVQSYSETPRLATQSPDHRWLLIQSSANLREFSLVDLKNPGKIDENTVPLTLPDNIITKAVNTENWQFGEWADDNVHVLLQHTFDGKTENILLDRSDIAQSLNVNTNLAVNPSKLTLQDKKFDQYYLYGADGALQTASVNNPSPTVRLQHVINYKTYGSNIVLFVTDNGAQPGKVLVKLAVGNKTYTLRSLAAGSSYVLDLAKYSGAFYVAAGSAADNRVYIYKDPAGQLDAQPTLSPQTINVLRVDQVNYLSFSANAQFIVAENGQKFALYDIENNLSYSYESSLPLDAPQPHASWMDGDRLTYVNAGKLAIVDYDRLNPHSLVNASSGYLPAFAPDYKYVYVLAPNANGQLDLTQTSLLTPADR